MNFNSADWKQLEDYCKTQLADDMNTLKSVFIGYDESQYLRGRIAVFEQILSLPNNPTELEAD